MNKFGNYKITFKREETEVKISVCSDFDKFCKILNDAASFFYEAIEDDFTISINK